VTAPSNAQSPRQTYLSRDPAINAGASKSRPILLHLPASSESTSPFSTNSIKKTSPVLLITRSEKPYKHALGSIELLKSIHYAKWNRNCRRILEGIRAWNIITGKEVEPNAPVGFNTAAIAERVVHTNYLERRAQVAAIISGSCSEEVQIELEGIHDLAEMWTVLAA